MPLLAPPPCRKPRQESRHANVLVPGASKHQISTQSNELEALEARIREMEERLRRSQQAGLAGFYRPGNPPPAAPASNTQTSASASSSAPGLPVRSSHRREAAPPPPVPKDDAYTQAQAQQKARSRPGTARQVAPSSGAMPPTPVASEGEYELVDGDNSEEEEEEDEEESSEEEPPARSPRRRHA